jgi:hypothetical protein
VRALRRFLRLVSKGMAEQRRAWTAWVLCRQFLPAVRRLAGTGVAGWFLFSLVLNAPQMLWLAVGLWLAATWRAGRNIEEEERNEERFVQWLRDVIGDRNGVLLSELLAAWHEADRNLDWDVAQVRSICERLAIPVRDKLRVGSAVSVGVHVDDLTRVWDVELTPPPPLVGVAPSGAVTSENYATTVEATPIAVGAAWSLHASRKPVPDEPSADVVEAERLRVQAVVNGADKAREEAFEDHLTDALGILHTD